MSARTSWRRCARISADERDGPGSRVRHRDYVRRSPASRAASGPPVAVRVRLRPFACICVSLFAFALSHAAPGRAGASLPAPASKRNPMHRRPCPFIGAPSKSRTRTPCTGTPMPGRRPTTPRQTEPYAPEDLARSSGRRAKPAPEPHAPKRPCPPPDLPAPRQTEPHTPEDLARPSGHRAKPAQEPPMHGTRPCRLRRTCPRHGKQNPMHQKTLPVHRGTGRNPHQNPMHQKRPCPPADLPVPQQQNLCSPEDACPPAGAERRNPRRTPCTSDLARCRTCPGASREQEPHAPERHPRPGSRPDGRGTRSDGQRPMHHEKRTIGIAASGFGNGPGLRPATTAAKPVRNQTDDRRGSRRVDKPDRRTVPALAEREADKAARRSMLNWRGAPPRIGSRSPSWPGCRKTNDQPNLLFAALRRLPGRHATGRRPAPHRSSRGSDPAR